MPRQIMVPVVNASGEGPSAIEAHSLSLPLQHARPATLALHADESLRTVKDIAPPIHVSTTFNYPDDSHELRPLYGRDIKPTEFVYSRESSQNGSRLEAVLSALLRAPTLTYASGLAAIHAAFTLINPKRVSIGDGYHGTHGVLNIHQRLTGCQKLRLDCSSAEISAGDLIFLETPVNPTGCALNIAHYAEKAHNRGAFLLVDSTFAPPPLQDPFQWGADIVMHSGTKYIGGHSDLLCGVLATNKQEWIARLAEDRTFLGSVVGSLEGWLGIRSVRTLELRLERQSENATELVRVLNGLLRGHDASGPIPQNQIRAIKDVVADIQHASLQRNDHSWLPKQMPNGYGPVFAMIMKSEEMAKALPSKLHFFAHATSLGGVESLVEWRAMSDTTTPRELLRFSIGIENCQDLLRDLLMGITALVESPASH